MSRLKFGILLFLMSLIPTQMQIGFGQTNQPKPDRFRYERKIIPGAPGPNRLLIDAALLAGGSSAWQFLQQTTGSGREPMFIATDGLRDLRLYDSSNREVPYLLISPPAPEPKWLEGRLSPLAVTKKTSGFQIDLGRSLLTDRLQLSGIPAPFVKRCILEASDDGSRWMRLRNDATVFDLPLEKLTLLEIEFLQSEYRYLKATWDDSASARVPLPGTVSVRLVSAGSLPPRLEVPLQIERRGSEPGVSRYRIRLPASRLPITAIKLSTTGGNVLRQARITEGRLSGGEIIPTVLGTATLRREVRGEIAAAEMSVPIAPPHEAQLDLVIEDGDNPPLEIAEVSALFAYLPWIYFESAVEQELTARYGYAGLNAPRYDLEAARATAEKAQTAEARWEAERPIKPEAESSAESGIPEAGSAIDLGLFRYVRALIAHKPGLSALPLDAAVLAHSRIADLRIAGTDGRQIPYLVEKMDEPLSLDLPALEKTQAPRSGQFDAGPGTAARSYYRLRLPFRDLPPARLVFTTSGRVFRRDLRILIERNPFNERQEPWTESIASATWAHADLDAAAQALTLTIPSLKTTEALVIVEEGDNSPLPIMSVKLLLPSHRLRFFRGSESEKLYYGRNDLEAPRYDLAMLAPRLVGVAAEEIRLGPEDEVAPIKARPISLMLFWGILIGTVLVLLILIARLVKKA